MGVLPAPDARRRGSAVRPRWSLRVSALEQCQYACPYCLPGSVKAPAGQAAWLTPQEALRLAPLFGEAGVDKVRFTGGEPLLREDLPALVVAFRQGLPAADLAVTTNGQHLARRLEDLVAAGLQRVNLHVDSLRPERYRALMGEGDVAAVLDAALDARAKLAALKVNVVVQRGHNDDEIADFLDWSKATGVEVRFIELMNTGSAPGYTQAAFFSGAAVLERARQRTPVHPRPRLQPSDPAARYATEDGVVFGIIASDTQPFCQACDRLRLSASGVLRGCMYQPGGVALLQALRDGADDEALRRLLLAGVGRKRSHHPDSPEARGAFSMADIGG